MKLSEIFRKAKLRLYTRNETTECYLNSYSCCAVEEACWEVSRDQFHEAVSYCREALLDCGLDNGLGPEGFMTNILDMSGVEQRSARFMWLELLALECEDTGN